MLDAAIDELIRGPQYATAQVEKDVRLTALLRVACRDMAARCPEYGRFLARFGGDVDGWQRLSDVPPLPVSVFKQLRLSAVPPDKVVRELLSSATTGQTPSRIFIDKVTAFRQARALAAVLKEHISSHRRPMLVLDVPESVAEGESLTARGAAIRGIGNFASEMVFALAGPARQAEPTGAGGEGSGGATDIEPNWPAIENFFAAHAEEPLLLFGFTYIVWSRFLREAQRQGLRFIAPHAVLLHSGGWKKLAAEAVTKEEFNARAAAVIGCPTQQILDFYGMVEQVGTVFVDCEAGNKHAPAFADVLIRRPGSLEPVSPGETGILEVVSVLPNSYPGLALLTEDQGRLIGVDDCPCGRRGSYFRFTNRIERAEIRGCGDTFADRGI